ncbi:MAG: DUF47 family protein [Chlorobi bacterium]|nr:DUF47 family protein [Chlorobiota bacterium]
MAFLFKKIDSIILMINDFFDTIDQGTLIFKEGINNYLGNDKEDFSKNISRIGKLESKADTLKRQIINKVYVQSLLPQYRGDILRLLEKTDEILDKMKETLNQFDVEKPGITKDLHSEYIKLTESSVLSVESLIPALRAYFDDVGSVKDKVHRVYFYENEADQTGESLKRKIFKLKDLKLSEKQHLRFFAAHIENLSDYAKIVADIVAIASIQRII